MDKKDIRAVLAFAVTTAMMGETPVVKCCREPQVIGGKCFNCGEWAFDTSDNAQGDNEG